MLKPINGHTKTSYTLIEALRTTWSDGSSRCDPSAIKAVCKGKEKKGFLNKSNKKIVREDYVYHGEHL